MSSKLADSFTSRNQVSGTLSSHGSLKAYEEPALSEHTILGGRDGLLPSKEEDQVK